MTPSGKAIGQVVTTGRGIRPGTTAVSDGMIPGTTPGTIAVGDGIIRSTIVGMAAGMAAGTAVGTTPGTITIGTMAVITGQVAVGATTMHRQSVEVPSVVTVRPTVHAIALSPGTAAV